MIKHDCFTTNVSIQSSLPEIESDKRTILDLPRSRWFDLFNPNLMKADPFLFVKDDTLYLFYEDMGFSHGGGRIMMMMTRDLKSWSNPVTVTHEPECHFSYPFIFEDNGNIYMMPETGREHQIRLYKAENGNLSDFKMHKIVLERPANELEGLTFDYADNSIYVKDGVYYLFTSYYKDNNYYLELYTSNNLDGEYTPHQMSPVCVGNKYGRCGGSLIQDDTKLYRVAQDCENEYGGQLHLMEIEEITPDTYKERVFKENLLPKSIYKEGGHQLNFANFKGQIIVATDVKYHCSFLLERVRLKLCRFFKLR